MSCGRSRQKLSAQNRMWQLALREGNGLSRPSEMSDPRIEEVSSRPINLKKTLDYCAPPR